MRPAKVIVADQLYNKASAYGFKADSEAAIDWFERAVHLDENLRIKARTAPAFNILREQPELKVKLGVLVVAKAHRRGARRGRRATCGVARAPVDRPCRGAFWADRPG